jgi:D-arabinitol 2-dehydrogenase
MQYQSSMTRSIFVRQAASAVKRFQAVGSQTSCRVLPTAALHPFHSSATFCDTEKKSSIANQLDIHEGSLARTDSTVEVEYPKVGELPAARAAQGRGGLHSKRTLASFSLEGRVAIVTGGARGLGLVMSQALVISGADIAIVDLNSMSTLSSG